MKNLLKSSIVFIVFAIALLVFDVSFKKEATAKITNTAPTKLVFAKIINPPASEIWSCNVDGTDMLKANLSMSFYQIFRISHTMIDDKIIFTAKVNSGEEPNMYSCNRDGSNVTKLTNEDPAGNKGIWIGSW
jgi:hypothetical protein